LLLRRGLRLEHATHAWNGFGSVVVLAAAAAAARSVALAGFGLDSLIEIAASARSSATAGFSTRFGIAHAEELDATALLLNVGNGTIDRA
jgi:hypothetical protein